MPRKPMVTRTLTVTKAKCICLDLLKEEAFEAVFTVPGKFTDTKKLMRKICAMNDNESVHVSKIKSYTTEQHLYAKTPEDFIKDAIILPNR